MKQFFLFFLSQMAVDPKDAIAAIATAIKFMHDVYKTVKGNKEQCKLLYGKLHQT
jgi:hypothetical protein